MCGIIGYVGKRKALPIILSGLHDLEYRGYDSAGVAVLERGHLSVVKCKGRINDLEKLLESRNLQACIGLGHTRWATHGKPSKVNAHPHTDCSGRITVVHNGIIENFDSLKKTLTKEGCIFKSQTDTEVIAHLIGKFYQGDIEEALRRAVKMLKGSYALAVMAKDHPDRIIGIRNDSPLVVGVGKGENFLASDTAAFLSYTNRVIFLEDKELVTITPSGIEITSLGAKRIAKKEDKILHTKEQVQKGGFKHFMFKEICQQPQIASKVISRYVTSKGQIKFKDFSIDQSVLEKFNKITIVACGTAYHAGLVGKYLIEDFTGMPVEVDLASEFRYRKPIIKDNTLMVAISQSGETADTLAAVREARKKKTKVLAICNVVGSTLTREVDSTIYIHAGPEISVASTKAYTAQLMVIYLFGLYLAGIKKTRSKKQIDKVLASLCQIPSKQKKVIESSKDIKKIARKYLHFGAFLYLGRHLNFPTALEGALKLKEISYIPAEGYAAGEMKHGPIALIDEYRAVVCVATDSFVFDKMVSNIQEILARKGKIIVVATLGNKKIRDCTKEIIYVPSVEEIFYPLLSVIALQLFAYFIADLKGYDVDKPRNLAKSVTVE
ncbi:MAG: glutamine--fructose-6-phosphate transaminase (isomerizing) [Candidatus Omnitrophica bacterium]|nr:glutamine--fructose-6-phosphate transaminase (isomerizing) [Candidatus Omnitrophota bacterium]